MENQSEATCPSCKFAVLTTAYFCSNCGKQLKDKPLATTLLKKIIVYSVSLFLPPFGFWYTWKYLKRADPESKTIGIVAAILTVISMLVTIWFTGGLISSINQSLDSINNFVVP